MWEFHSRKKGVNFPDYPDNLRNCLQQKAEAGKICKASWISEDVMSLLLEMLQIVPSKRKTAEKVQLLGVNDYV